MRILCFLALTIAAGAQTVKVEIDNTWVRTLRETLAPNEKIAPKAHPDSVVIYLSGPRKDEVAWRAAGNYGDENPSGQPLQQVVIELKPPANGHSTKPPTLDPVKLDAEHHLVPLENSRVRVLRTILEPHLKSPMHEHPHYVVVYLTVLHTTMKMGDGREVDNPRQPGDIAWRDDLKHETENIGEQRAVEIQVEIK